MIIDSHQHFWKYDPVRDSWIDNTMQVIRRDFLPQDLAPILKANHIDGCVAIQADQSEEETNFLLQCAKDNSFIKGVVGWVDLLSDNLENRLFHFAKNKKFRGVRHIVQAESDDFLLSKKFQDGISMLQQFGFTYDLLVFPSQLPAAITLVNKFENQLFVLDHIGKPEIKHGNLRNWKKDIKSLAKSQNVYCKISGLVTESDWKNWTKKDFKKYLDVVFNAFGIERIMYGSDWPVCLLAAQYQEQLEIIEDYISWFTDDEKALIMGGNTIKFYNLKP